MDEQDEFVKYVAGGIFRYGHAQRSSDVILWFVASGAFCIGSILRSWGYSQKVPVGRHARRAPDDEIREFQKAMPDLIKKRTTREQS